MIVSLVVMCAYLGLVLRDKRTVFFMTPHILQQLYLCLSLVSHQIENNIIYFFMGLLSFRVFALWYAVSSTPNLEFFFVRFVSLNKERNRVKISGILLAWCVLIGVYAVHPEAVLNPRGTYEMLMSGTAQGSIIWFVVAMFATLSMTYATSFRMLLVLTPFFYLIGAKGFFMGLLIFYFTYTFLERPQRLLILIPFLLLSLYAMLYLNVKTDRNVIEFLIFSYFDYAYSIDQIAYNDWILPSVHSIPVLNEYVLGVSRLIGVNKDDFAIVHFPFETSLGVNPGLLDFELIFRLGVLIFPFFVACEVLLLRAFFSIALRQSGFLLFRATFLLSNWRLAYIIFGFISVRNWLRRR